MPFAYLSPCDAAGAPLEPAGALAAPGVTEVGRDSFAAPPAFELDAPDAAGDPFAVAVPAALVALDAPALVLLVAVGVITAATGLDVPQASAIKPTPNANRPITTLEAGRRTLGSSAAAQRFEVKLACASSQRIFP